MPRIEFFVALLVVALVVVREYVPGRVVSALVALGVTLLYGSASWILLERPLLRR